MANQYGMALSLWYGKHRRAVRNQGLVLQQGLDLDLDLDLEPEPPEPGQGSPEPEPEPEPGQGSPEPEPEPEPAVGLLDCPEICFSKLLVIHCSSESEKPSQNYNNDLEDTGRGRWRWGFGPGGIGRRIRRSGPPAEQKVLDGQCLTLPRGPIKSSTTRLSAGVKLQVSSSHTRRQTRLNCC
ncbi:hypothetical protein EYF80_017514 [Liparis tanakae]|uniref:Uncharacterized protein n=1 Tax=Liparis tanakae TaxID=230148 RepID=A0A4Z2I327_9TELE|nr:hypothetical protein EYF80_017514 [Liparis tanakae]